MATARIEELSAQAKSVDAALADLEVQKPQGPSAEQIETMLSSVPDLSEALDDSEGEELAELLDAFDVSVSYDKPASKLNLSAAISDDLLGESEATAATEKRSQVSVIAGAGFEPATFGL